MQHMGGQFLYRQVVDSMVIDPERTPTETTQQDLTREIEAHQALFDLDHQYCIAVEGASQEGNLWVPRNQSITGLTDVDLQRFKSIAWNECVVKRFLTGQSQEISATGASMLHIVRTLNLQWKSMEVMGLHPKVESAEKQIVMVCMEQRLLPQELDIGRVARCLRRCHHFRDYFANAVGCHVVAKTGHTPGLAKTQYATDLDYVYKNQGFFFLHKAFSKNKSLIAQCLAQDGFDYVPRLCGIKLVSNTAVTLHNPPEKPHIIYDQSSPRPQKKARINEGISDGDTASRENLGHILAEIQKLRDIPSQVQKALEQTIAKIPQPQLAPVPVPQFDNRGVIEEAIDGLDRKIQSYFRNLHDTTTTRLQEINELQQTYHHLENSHFNEYTSSLARTEQNLMIAIMRLDAQITNPTIVHAPPPVIAQPPPPRPAAGSDQPLPPRPASAPSVRPPPPPPLSPPLQPRRDNTTQTSPPPENQLSPSTQPTTSSLWRRLFERTTSRPHPPPAAAGAAAADLSGSDDSMDGLPAPPNVTLTFQPIETPAAATKRTNLHQSQRTGDTLPPTEPNDLQDIKNALRI
jgi:hypothetical protein